MVVFVVIAMMTKGEVVEVEALEVVPLKRTLEVVALTGVLAAGN